MVRSPAVRRHASGGAAVGVPRAGRNALRRWGFDGWMRSDGGLDDYQPCIADRMGRIGSQSHQTVVVSRPSHHDRVVLVGSRFIKTQPLDVDRVAHVAYPFGWEWI
jgi:hypothetical protein